jgi:hypothetical protein
VHGWRADRKFLLIERAPDRRFRHLLRDDLVGVFTFVDFLPVACVVSSGG